MKILIATSALALTGAMMGGCATTYSDTPAVAPAVAHAKVEPVAVAEADNKAMPYTTTSMFFKDRGLHFEDPSVLAPKVVIANPAPPPRYY
jgi:hypothetical protein